MKAEIVSRQSIVSQRVTLDFHFEFTEADSIYNSESDMFRYIRLLESLFEKMKQQSPEGEFNVLKENTFDL